MVSVVIPSYNRLSFIGKAIDSAMIQEPSPIEIIVVDDGSSDGSVEFLRSYVSWSGFRFLTHKNNANLGQSASINLGIRAAIGEYIAILDSDDQFAETKLMDQVAFLESHPDVGMVYGQGYAIDEQGRFLFKLPCDDHAEKGDPNKLLLDCFMAIPGGSLIRKSVFDTVGLFEEDFRAGQDHDMALRIMEATKVAYLPKLAFYYRKHGDSISVNGLRRRWMTGQEILRRAASRYPYKKSTIRKRKAVLNFRLGQTFWRESSKLHALKYFFVAGVLDPVRALKVLTGNESVR